VSLSLSLSLLLPPPPSPPPLSPLSPAQIPKEEYSVVVGPNPNFPNNTEPLRPGIKGGLVPVSNSSALPSDAPLDLSGLYILHNHWWCVLARCMKEMSERVVNESRSQGVLLVPTLPSFSYIPPLRTLAAP
jgi:hypothetical protein